jgi:hypothetical protein
MPDDDFPSCLLLRGISGRGIVGGGGTCVDRLGGIGGGGPDAAVDFVVTVGSADVVFVNVDNELLDVLFLAGNGGGTIDFEVKLLLLLE